MRGECDQKNYAALITLLTWPEEQFKRAYSLSLSRALSLSLSLSLLRYFFQRFLRYFSITEKKRARCAGII